MNASDAGLAAIGRTIDVDLGVEYLADSPPSPVLRLELINEWLNEKVMDGWRLITVESGTFYFQRPARRLRQTKEHHQ